MASSTSHHSILTNFCCDWFVSSVNCESVTADGYSCSNLISADPNTRSRGLRVEHYIRPPVTVTVNFCCPVKVSCILICPDLCEQAEMRVELSGSAGGTGQLKLLSARPLLGRSGCLLVARGKHFDATIQKQELASLPSLANMVVQRSYGYKDLKQSQHVESPLKHDRVLRHLRHLQLKVIRWTGPKPVNIKWLEVWGVVSSTCSGDEMSLFLRRLKASKDSPDNNNINKCGQPPGMFTDRDSSDSTSQQLTLNSPSHSGHVGGLKGKIVLGSTSALTSNQSDEIPEQFLDELTFEVMVLPMLMPSGHYVDKSTVDKLAVGDATYGRPPTDPFTGIPFTGACKPEFCARLKAQLDNYLTGRNVVPVSTSDSVASGRTVGSSDEIQRHLLQNGKTRVSSTEGSLSPASKRVRLHEDWPVDCTADRGIESEHPASALSLNRMPQHASAFDLQVGKSLDLALNQLLSKHK